VSDWLRRRIGCPTRPSTDEEWSAAAEVALWIGWLNIAWPLGEWLPDNHLAEAFRTLPLTIAADLAVGLHLASGEKFAEWSKVQRSIVVDRFRREQRTPMLHDDGLVLTAHFIIDPDLFQDSAELDETLVLDSKNQLHNQALVRVDLLRRLFPDREAYGSQGYGHGAWDLGTQSDATRKTGIPRQKLPLRTITSVNSTFAGIVEYRWRPEDWLDYANQVVGLREEGVRCLRDLTKALPPYLAAQRSTQLLGSAIPNQAWHDRWRTFREPPLLPKSAVDEWGFVHETLVAEVAKAHRSGGPALLARSLALEGYRPLMEQTKKYAGSLQNFVEQAPDVMKDNAAVRKGSDRRTVTTSASLSTVREAQVSNRLSGFNLGEAWKAVSNVQIEYRRLLGHVLPGKRLEDLEQREAALFSVAWPLWHAFALAPGQVLRMPERDARDQLERVMGLLRRNLRRELLAMSFAETRFGIAADGLQWENDPALWLTIDGLDALVVYEAQEVAFMAVRRAVESVPPTTMRDYALDFNWRNVVVVPLVRGKSLTSAAARAITATLTRADEANAISPWNLIPQAIPSQAIRNLGLSTWDDPRLHVGFRLTTAANELWTLAAHVHDLVGLPELDELGGEIVRQHLVRISDRLNDALQALLSARTEMIGAINTVPSVELERRQHLALTAEALDAILPSVLPAKDLQESASLELRAFGDWSERLRNDGFRFASIAHLAWSSDVLSRPDS